MGNKGLQGSPSNPFGQRHLQAACTDQAHQRMLFADDVSQKEKTLAELEKPPGTSPTGPTAQWVEDK